jgi:predicted transcriptional regulator YdeE
MQKYSHTSFQVTGIVARIDNAADAEKDIHAAWMKFMSGNYSEKITGKEFPGVHVVYYNYENPEDVSKRSYDMLIGFLTKTGEVQSDPEVTTLEIPDQNYEYLEVKGEMPTCVVDGWKQINALSVEECKRTYKFDLDMYAEDRTGATLTVSVQ